MTEFLNAPVDKSLGATGAWTDIDLSGDVPVTATGAIFQVINTDAGGSWYFGLRKKGSTDTRYDTIDPERSLFSIVGIDSNRKCQGKIEDVLVDFHLVGYTENDATFFTNAYDKSQTATGGWTDLDLSSELPSGAVAAIFEISNIAAVWRSWGLRKKGSTDDRYGDLGGGLHVYFIVGVDSNRECQFKIESNEIDFYLVGYLTCGAAETNGIDRSLGITGSYGDITETDAPSGATGVFVEFDTTEYWKYYAARENGSAWDKYCLVPANKCAIFVGIDGSKKWEGKIEAVTHDFYTLGYFVPGIVEKTSSDTGAGVDADSGVLASLNQSDTGSGIEALSNLMAAIVNAETGAGADAILESLASRVEAETGVGVDALLYLIKGIAKYSSDVGVGADALSNLLSEIIQSDQGAGEEALGSRVFGSEDEGIGVDEILELALSGSDTGIGSDELKALLATIQGSDTGTGTEAQAIDICICLLLKLLQKKGLNIELSQDQKG